MKIKIIILLTSLVCLNFGTPTQGIVRSQQQVIFDGNSLTQKDGTNADLKYYLPLKLYGTLRSNSKLFAGQHYGVTGKNTVQLINDFPTKIAPYLKKGDIVVFWEITNDLHTNSATAQQAYDNLVTYAGLVHDKGAKIVVLGFIARDVVGQAADINTRGFACNALIEANHSWCDGWVNLGTNVSFDSAADCANTTYYLTDKIHLTNAGYDLVSSLIESTVRGLIK